MASSPPDAVRASRTVVVYDHCTCGKVLHSLREAESGQCSTCWVKGLSPEKRGSMNRLLKSAFDGSSDAQKDEAVKDALKHFGTASP